MAELVLFYSFGGHTRRLAQALAASRGSDIEEVFDLKKKPSVLGAFLRCPAAMGQKSAPIRPIEKDLAAYDRFVVMGPIWAGHPAPVVNAILAALPKGAKLELHMVSGGGESAKDRVLALAARLGLEVSDYQDLRGGE